ncbi:copper amine oxidase N-terminal domain-containing protein [Paenibacillus durus]|uniref:copper amine oxidase N-terminal domain-containing protein n=1 Tax=Paenibacillus durus TaxID=44251 RepID=UPI0004720D96|nr:copper amine oxidase N-terminal domain-containing protein [Paenibacillus durus]
MKKRLLFISAIVSSLLLSGGILPPSTAQAEAVPAYVQLTFTNGGTLTMGSSGNAIIKDGVAYLAASTALIAGLKITWDQTHKRAEFTGWEKSFTVRVGSRTGVLDGKAVSIGGVPFIYNKELYIPVKFMVKALEGGTVRWDDKKRTFLANGLHLYRSYSETFEGTVYSVSLDTGELYESSRQGEKVKIADLGTNLDVVDFTFERTSGGLLLLRISNIYGEPHVNTAYFTFVLRNGAVIRKGQIAGRASFGEPAARIDGKLLLSDGRTLRLVEDGTGNVAETVDLAKLMNADATQNADTLYHVEAFYSDVALIRPSNTGLLTLVDRSTGASTLLYREFFDADRQREIEEGDPWFLGDFLRFAGRSGDTLTFTYNTGHEIVKYTHILPAAPQQ